MTSLTPSGQDATAPPEGIVDLWSLATNDAHSGRAILMVGESTCKDVLKLMSMEDESPVLQVAKEGWAALELEDLYVQFNPDQKLAGIAYGFRTGDILPGLVQTAVARMSHGDVIDVDEKLDIPFGYGNTTICFNGGDVRTFATLPRFIQGSYQLQPFRLTSRPYDKWIRAQCKTAEGIVTAEFLLKAFKTEMTEHFQVDYCLYGLSFMSHAALARPV